MNTLITLLLNYKETYVCTNEGTQAIMRGIDKAWLYKTSQSMYNLTYIGRQELDKAIAKNSKLKKHELSRSICKILFPYLYGKPFYIQINKRTRFKKRELIIELSLLSK